MMKLFASLLCIAIGSVFGELERRNFAEEKLEIAEDYNETSSLISLHEDDDDDRKTADNSDESLRVKYTKDNSLDQIAASAKDAGSVEQKTSRNPSPVIETGPVKETFANFLKWLLMSTDALGRKERILESNSRKHLRIKRTTEVEDPTNIVKSFRTYILKLQEKIPKALRWKMRKTDAAEEKLLRGYAESKGDTSNLIADYNAAKLAEREQLKLVANGSGATEVIGNYKAIRKGKPWNYIKLRGRFNKFFGKTSPSLTDYENLKQDEAASIDSFLGGSSNTGSEKKDKNEKLQGKEKSAEQNVTQEANKTTEGEKPKEEEAKNETNEDTNRLWDKILNDTLGKDWNCMKSLTLYEGTKATLAKDLQDAMNETDLEENELLENSTSEGKFLRSKLGSYHNKRKHEIDVLKGYLGKQPQKIQDRILLIYNNLRRGIPWNWILYTHKGFFEGNISKQDVADYLEIKKQEKNTAKFLNGSMKIGDVVPEDGEAEEKMKRGVREKVEAAGSKEDSEGHGSTDNVTETTRDRKTNQSNHLLRFAILFGMVSHILTAILILRPRWEKLAEWCKRRMKTESGHTEKEPLRVGEKV